MSDPLAEWWVHDTTVARYTGAGALGPAYADPVDQVGLVDDSTKLVVNGLGEQVVSSARVFYPAAVADIPPLSLVTLRAPFGDREAKVILAQRHDAGGQGTPDHLEVALG